MPAAVVTGCNSGIGHAFAQVLIKEDYFVYALDATAGEKLTGLHGPKCQIGRLDITSLESIWEFKKSIGDRKINVLLNVAGELTPFCFGSSFSFLSVLFLLSMSMFRGCGPGGIRYPNCHCHCDCPEPAPIGTLVLDHFPCWVLGC